MLGGFAASGALRVVTVMPEEPIVIETSVTVEDRTVSVGVVNLGRPLGSDEYDFIMTVGGSPASPIFVQPSRWWIEVEDSATALLVEWSVEVDSVEYSSGSVSVPANLTVPAAFTAGQWQLTDDTAPATVPDAFGSTDWTLVEATVAATVPDAFVAGDWVLEANTNNPPPSGGNGTLTAPTSVAAAKQSDRVVRVTWGPPATGTATSYEVDYSTNAATWTTATGQTSPADITVPTGGQLYYFRVRARNATTEATSGNVTATTDVRAYGTAAEWNLPISQVLSRGLHPNESYFRDILWEAPRGRRGPGDNLFTLFDRDYTYPVYKSSDASGQTATAAVNFGNWRTGVVPWNPSWTIPAGTDNQFIILDETTGVEYNAWQVRYDSGTNRIVPSVSGSGRVSRVTANADETGGAGDYRTKTSGFRPSRGCGIQYLAMLIRPEEIAQGKIYHALSCVMGRSGYRYYANPATKGERFPGNEADQGIPQGTRWYYDVTDGEIEAHLATLPAAVSTAQKNTLRIVFRAMREYGLIASDQGGANHIQFQHDASTDWTPYGMDEVTASNGKVYPRDALDFFPLDKTKIKFVRPPDGVLHYYEQGSDNPPRPPVALTGTFESVQRTTAGTPFIERSGTTITLTRRAQFVGAHPLTTNAVSWRRNGVQVSSGGTFYNTSGVAGTYTAVESATNANGTASQTSNSITI
jgi:hypothetical protein